MKSIYSQRCINLILLFMAFTWCALAHPDLPAFICLVSTFSSLACVWFVLSKMTLFEQKIYSTIGFSAVALVHLRWMVSTNYHGVAMIFVWLILALLFGLQITFLTLFVLRKQTQGKWADALLFSGLWMSLEMMRVFLFSGFPFFSLAISLIKAPALMQIASWIGVYGVSGCIVLVNALIFFGIRSFDLKKIICAAVGVAFVAVLGCVRLGQSAFHDPASVSNIALVQTGWAPEDKIYIVNAKEPLSVEEQWSSILKLLKPIKNTPLHAVVLPESAISFGAQHVVCAYEEIKSMFLTIMDHPVGMTHHVDNRFIAQQLALCMDSDIIIGLDSQDIATGKSFNSAFHITKKQQPLEAYHKQILVPMGEYLPSRLLSKLAKRYGLHSFYSHGTSQKHFMLLGNKILPTICYEECFSHFMKNQVEKETAMIVNLTNDGWFSPSSLPKEHLFLAQFRAVETGRWIARACVTGITCIIDSYGKIQQQLPQRNQDGTLFSGVLITQVPHVKSLTVFCLFGELFTRIFSSVCCIEIMRKSLVMKILRSNVMCQN